MLEIIARGQGCLATLLEEGNTLVAAVQKRLIVVLAVDGHAQQLGVKLLGAGHVLHVQNEMVDTIGLYHVTFLLSSGVSLRPSGWEVCHAPSRDTAHHSC